MRVVKASAVQLSPVLYSREGTVEKIVRKIHEQLLAHAAALHLAVIVAHLEDALADGVLQPVLLLGDVHDELLRRVAC